MLCVPPDQRVCTLWVLLYCIDGVVSKIVVCCMSLQIRECARCGYYSIDGVVSKIVVCGVSLQIRECARCGYYYTVLMVLYQRLWCVVCPSRSESVHVVGTTILY